MSNQINFSFIKILVVILTCNITVIDISSRPIIYDCYMIVLVCMCVVIKFWKHMIEIQLNQNSRLNHNMADSSGTNIESN